MTLAIEEKHFALTEILVEKRLVLPVREGFISSSERDNFIQEIKAIKNNEGLIGKKFYEDRARTLRFILKPDNPDRKPIFFSNPTIYNYI